MASDTPRTDDALGEVAAHKPFHPVAPSFIDVCRKLERELSLAQSQIAALKADAERYRWLRDKCNDSAASVYFRKSDAAADDWVSVGQNSGAGISLDIEIDAALHAKQPENDRR